MSSSSIVQTAFVEAATELEGKFVLVPADIFLEGYLPLRDGLPSMPAITEQTKTAFTDVCNKQVERDMYEPLVRYNTQAVTLLLTGAAHCHKTFPQRRLVRRQHLGSPRH